MPAPAAPPAAAPASPVSGHSLRSPPLAQNVLVLGGAKGPAYGLARLLSQQGARILLTDREAETAQMAARSLGQSGAACDPVSNRAIAKLAYDAADLIGDIDLLVVALDDSLSPGRSTAMTEADFLAHLQGQSLPLLHVARHFAPAMRARKRGAVLVMAQIPARADPWQDAAEAWVTAALRGLAREWAAEGVAVNGVIALRGETAPLPKFMQTPAASPNAPALPLGRMAESPEIAEAALPFCRPLAGVTGQVLRFDAGRALYLTP